MKLLVVSDLHYTLKQYDWLVSVAADYDVVLIAGDLLEISSMVDLRAQIVVVRTYLERLTAATRVIACSGNHDLDAEDRTGERVPEWLQGVRDLGVACDGDCLHIGETLVSVCPWWDGPESRRAVEAQLARDAAQDRDAWIWVYHAPPAESPVSWSGRRHFGDPELSGWIERFRPDIVLSGHVHESPFVNAGSWVDRIGGAWVFNSGRQIGEVPAHIVINTDVSEAVWFSLAGAETLRLDQPLQRPLEELRELPEWLRA